MARLSLRRLHRPWVWLLCAAPLLAGCENSATAFTVDSSQHALILVREQPYFWTSSVDQALVVSRLPQCQRRVKIHPDATTLTTIEVYSAGDLLWALRQGGRWYLASTATCQVQDWDNQGGEVPGPLVGHFALRNGSPTFMAQAAEGAAGAR